MARSRKKSKNRLEKGTYVQVRKDVLNHPNYASLSHKAARLLWDIWGQYNGSNNGDFEIKSAHKLLAAIRALERVGDHCTNIIESAIYIKSGLKVQIL